MHYYTQVYTGTRLNRSVHQQWARTVCIISPWHKWRNCSCAGYMFRTLSNIKLHCVCVWLSYPFRNVCHIKLARLHALYRDG